MVNVYTEYFKALMDYLYTLVGSSVDSEKAIELTYVFDDYQPSVGQQKQLIDTLVKAGVLEITYKIPLAPLVKLAMNTNGNRYSATGCAGYGMVLNKEAFLKYRVSNPMIKTLKDEHELSAPYLVEDGEVLMLWDAEPVRLRKRNNKTQPFVLANMIFQEDGYYSCRVEDFIRKYYDTEDVSDHKINISTVLNNFNDYVGHKELLKQSNGLIYYDGPGSGNKEKFLQ